MNTEKLAADTLLERGVKVALPAPFICRLFGRKTITLYVHRPSIDTLLRIASLYLSMDIDTEKLKELDMEDGFALYEKHGPTIIKIAAEAICARDGMRYIRWYI